MKSQKQRDGFSLIKPNAYNSNLNELNKNVNNSSHTNNTISKIAKYDKTQFAKKKIVVYPNDENHKFELLNQFHKFYPEDERDFEKNKWKMFNKKHNTLIQLLLPKRCVYWLKLMMKKGHVI